jgi:hypothetical protein
MPLRSAALSRCNPSFGSGESVHIYRVREAMPGGGGEAIPGERGGLLR